MDLSTGYCRNRHCRQEDQSGSGARLESAGWHRGADTKKRGRLIACPAYPAAVHFFKAIFWYAR